MWQPEINWLWTEVASGNPKSEIFLSAKDRRGLNITMDHRAGSDDDLDIDFSILEPESEDSEDMLDGRISSIKLKFCYSNNIKGIRRLLVTVGSFQYPRTARIPTACGGSVTIGCGQYVLLDVDGLVLYKLNITGALLVANNRNITITSNFIFVYGFLYAGTPSAPYTRAGRGKFRIILTTPPNNVSDPAAPWLGFKTLAVQGGVVSFNGMPGGGATNAWGRLSGTVPVGANSLTLDRSPAGLRVSEPEKYLRHLVPRTFIYRAVMYLHVVAPEPKARCTSFVLYLSADINSDVGWSGEQIVIASTDFDVWQSEVVTITAVNTTTNKITFVPPLYYEHYGYPIFTGVPGRYMQQTFARQFIQGVEFVNMGQQGNLGRSHTLLVTLMCCTCAPHGLALCIRVCESTGTIISKNCLRNNKQRGVVIHGSNYTHRHRQRCVEQRWAKAANTTAS
eukprot:jgi/Botrbrau1/9415/Bobra.0252s0040.1